MKIDDEFSILDRFNEACAGVAELIQLWPSLKPFEVELDVIIPDVDDWWRILIDGKDIKQRYVEYMRGLTPEERDTYIEKGQTILTEFSEYNEHYKAMRERPSAKITVDLHYLPHFINKYFDNVLHEMDGYKSLTETLNKQGLQPRIYLTPKEQKHEDVMDQGNLHGWGNYCFVLVTERISQPKAKPSSYIH